MKNAKILLALSAVLVLGIMAGVSLAQHLPTGLSWVNIALAAGAR